VEWFVLDGGVDAVELRVVGQVGVFSSHIGVLVVPDVVLHRPHGGGRHFGQQQGKQPVDFGPAGEGEVASFMEGLDIEPDGPGQD
jgi:hypothetical protein